MRVIRASALQLNQDGTATTRGMAAIDEDGGEAGHRVGGGRTRVRRAISPGKEGPFTVTHGPAALQVRPSGSPDGTDYRADNNRSPMLSVLALITLTCAILAGCIGASVSSPNRAATPAPSPSRASGAHRAGPFGTAGNPLVLTCAAEAFPGYGDPPVPSHPRPDDLAIGPLYIAGGRMVATETPAQYGYAPYGRNGRSRKMGLVVTIGSTATVTIAPAARGHVVIDNPAARNLGLGGVTSSTYDSCPTRKASSPRDSPSLIAQPAAACPSM